MSSNNIIKKKDSRPKYVSPQAVRLDDVYNGAGGRCSPVGSGVTSGNCRMGSGADQRCLTGNGATIACDIGNGEI